MSIIEALKEYLEGYAGLATGAPVWVNYVSALPVEYSIVPLTGERVVESYLNGVEIRAFPFALWSTESTADDLARLANVGFYEAFADWLDAQTEAGDLPALGAGKTAESIAALGHGVLFQQGDSQSGIYQIQCLLTYRQEA